MSIIDKNEKGLILLGGGGHCRSVIDVLEQLNWPVYGIIDAAYPEKSEVLGLPVIGKDEDIPKYIDHLFLVTTGQIISPRQRMHLHAMVEEIGGKFATVISPLAHVSKYATIEPGTVVMNYANVSANAQIGKGCIINTMADIEHDSIIGDFCHISTGAIINGKCSVGAQSFVGSHATIFQAVSLPERSIIRAGAVVKSDMDCQRH